MILSEEHKTLKHTSLKRGYAPQLHLALSLREERVDEELLPASVALQFLQFLENGVLYPYLDTPNHNIQSINQPNKGLLSYAPRFLTPPNLADFLYAYFQHIPLAVFFQ